ncbi:MAG: toxin-antitoxin system YwqK family antitoxin [Bacteroidota bacterium]
MTFKVRTIKLCSVAVLLGTLIAFYSLPGNSEGQTAEESTAHTVVLKNELIDDREKGLVCFKGRPFSGQAIAYHQNGMPSLKIHYSNGLKHGDYFKYFKDGSTSFQGHYVHGKPHGEAKSWWRNGNLRSTSNYVNGIGQGAQWQWYKNGVMFKRIQLVDGKEEGIQQSWRKNGKLYNNYEAKNGRVFGLKRSKLCFSLENEVVQR